MMKRREVITLLGGAAAAWPMAARAQQPGKTYRIGILSAGTAEVLELEVVFSDALRELGWIEGKNVILDYRYADNRLERLPELAADLVRLKVDVIMAIGTLAPLAAKQTTTTTPIIMAAAGDPVASGLVTSLARPGGNVTGMSLMVPDVAGKRLELLRAIVPRIAQVAVLWNGANPYPGFVFKETQVAGHTLGVRVQSLEVQGASDFDSAFEAARRQRPDALITIEDPLTVSYRKPIAEFATAQQLPTLHGVREFVVVGGLMSYGASIADLRRRAAGYVDKILRGAKPADLPVQQPTKFELVINRKTAKQLGLDVPLHLQQLADEVID